MPAHNFKIEIDQGATYNKVITWKAGTPKNAAPVDLTGCKARAQVRADIDSPEVLLELTTENGRIVLGGPTGKIRIVIDAVTTAAIKWDGGVYDLEVEFPDGVVERRLAGAVVVSKGVTRDD